MTTYIIIHITCAVLAWFILINDWRRSFDVTLQNAIGTAFFTIILGPLMLITAIMVEAAQWIGKRLSDPIIWRRKQ
jgi:hypothetical protein